ncbi:uncharacterized protein PV09_06394 [Verruconis gallopava]|uniref:Mitochondrial intermembrane space import and assembly protein 40 n=1 Tax=Verruconis gallopava TaxID=253628 RepID=A0A0D1XIT7_9PEZI|nr:uncharacterized protein PV09_06394 [Verruconis gallopava]KIW02241.1 hypothetical protein PV09_06394 [Verruconis gallopava]
MFRPVARAAVRTACNTTTTFTARRLPARRWASTAADKPRSWKNSAIRWGLAGAIVYYYNTSNVFAEDVVDQYAQYPPAVTSETEALPTLESYAKKSKAPLETSQTTSTPEMVEGEALPTPSEGAEDLEAEASQQGAFNEETGEINWDCPCLGGMAHGPCGEEFKAAFSCFVYSKEEPKGVDCIDKFKGMQDCFRAHPDIYGAELEDDEEEDAPGEEDVAPALARDASAEASGSSDAVTSPISTETAQENAEGNADKAANKAIRPEVSAKVEPISESADLVPKAAHDATDASSGSKSEA